MRIGIVGLGHLGQIHLKCLSKTSFEIVGCYDIDQALTVTTAETYGIKAFDSYEALLSEVEVVDIVSTSATHFQLSQKALELQKHVFIEKPFVSNLKEAKVIYNLTKQSNCKVQIGHVERYNPSVKSVQNLNMDAKFIEAHRLSMFNPRGTDVSVVMDLMIHDIDLVCHFIPHEIKSVDANGVCVVSASPDICSARIVFENGAVANLTASRISLKNMRKFRIFEGSQYISLDLLEKEAQVVQIKNPEDEQQSENYLEIETATGRKHISVEMHETVANNAIEDELNDFYTSIVQDAKVKVGVAAGIKSMRLAQLILESIELNNEKVSYA